MLRVILVFVIQLVLWVFMSVVNHHLAPFQITLYAGSLFIVYAGLKMGPREGMAVAVLSGLLFDSASPLGYGHNMLLHLFAFMVLLRMRIRLAQDERSVQIAVTVMTNLMLGIAKFLLSFWIVGAPEILWGRFFLELISSAIFVGLLGPWAIALQWRFLSIMEQDRFRRQEED